MSTPDPIPAHGTVVDAIFSSMMEGPNYPRHPGNSGPAMLFEEFIQVREDIPLSDEDLVKTLRIGERTLRSWERGALIRPRYAMILRRMRYCYRRDALLARDATLHCRDRDSAMKVFEKRKTVPEHMWWRIRDHRTECEACTRAERLITEQLGEFPSFEEEQDEISILLKRLPESFRVIVFATVLSAGFGVIGTIVFLLNSLIAGTQFPFWWTIVPIFALSAAVSCVVFGVIENYTRSEEPRRGLAAFAALATYAGTMVFLLTSVFEGHFTDKAALAFLAFITGVRQMLWIQARFEPSEEASLQYGLGVFRHWET